MGGNAVLLKVNSLPQSVYGTIGNRERRVRFLGLIAGFDGLLYRKHDYSARKSPRDSTSWHAVTAYTVVATISREPDVFTV
jgi:hypothetical protein